MEKKKGNEVMNDKKVLEMLSELECDLFHASTDNPEHTALKEAHATVRKALENFAKATGVLK